MRRFYSQIDLREASIARPEGKPARLRIPLLPEGKFPHPWYDVLDWSPERLQRMVDNHRKGCFGNMPMLNFGHDRKGPAAGWIPWDALEYVPGTGLFGDVELTDLGEEAIARQHYRYISSEWYETYTSSTGDKTPDVFSGAALTNQPFHETMPGLFGDHTPEGLACFSTSGPASYWVGDDTRRPEEPARKRDTMSLIDKARRFFGLPETASDAEVEAKLEAGNTPEPAPAPDPRVAALETEIAALRAERQREAAAQAEEKAAALVDRYIAAGKLAPAQRDAGLALARLGEPHVAAILDAAKPVIDTTPAGFTAQGEAGEAALSPADEKEIADLAKHQKRPVAEVRAEFAAVRAQRQERGLAR